MGFYGNATYYLPNGIAQDVAKGVITTEKLAEDAVTASKIADTAIHGKGNSSKWQHIAKESIAGGENGDIAKNTITNYNIAPTTIQQYNMADNSIGTNQIINGNITKDKLANDYLEYIYYNPDGGITFDGLKTYLRDGKDTGPKRNNILISFQLVQDIDYLSKGNYFAIPCPLDGSYNGGQVFWHLTNLNTKQEWIWNVHGNIQELKNTDINIAEDAIKDYHIDNNQIHGSGDNLDHPNYQHIAEKSIGTNDIADKAIKRNQINDWAVQKEHIAGHAIQGLASDDVFILTDGTKKSHIAPKSIAGGENGDIALDTITGGSQKGKGNIAEKTIDTYNIADQAIKTDQIDMGAITTDKIENNAVTMDELNIYSVHGLKGEKSENGKNSHIFPESIAGGVNGDIAQGTITDYNIDSISKNKISDMNCYESITLESRTYASVYSLISILKTFEVSFPIFVTKSAISFDSRELPSGKYFIMPLSNASWTFFNQKLNTFYEIQDDTAEWAEGEDINNYIAIYGRNWSMDPYKKRRISEITAVVSNWDQYSIHTTYCEILNIIKSSNGLTDWNSAETSFNSKATVPVPGQYLAIIFKQYSTNSIYFIGLDNSYQYLSSYDVENSSWLTQEIVKSKTEISTFDKKELIPEGPQTNCQLQLTMSPNAIYSLDQPYNEALYYQFKYEGYNYIQLFKSEIFSQDHSSTIYCSLPDEGSFIQNKTNLPIYCSLPGLPSIIINSDNTIISNDILNKIYGTSMKYNIIMKIKQVKIDNLDALECQINVWNDLLSYEDFYKA